MQNDTPDAPTLNIIDITANIVAAYASGNHFAASELPKVITAVHGALNGLAQPQPQPVAQTEAPIDRPTALQIKNSITPDALISFVDGRPYMLLQRHLRRHGMGPADYRRRYGLPDDYPMTAASYSAKRSAHAKAMGLGRFGGQAERQAAERDWA